MTSTATTTTNSTPAVILPPKGSARVKSVLSGDSVILLGKPPANGAPPVEVIFTFESVNAPRLASKSTPKDEPGAFSAREWLRQLVVGKAVRFETRKQGGNTPGDRVYGWLFLSSNDGSEPLHLAVESVRAGFAVPKAIKYPGKQPEEDDPAVDDSVADADDYESQLLKAYKEAEASKVGIHADVPLVRSVKNAGEHFTALALVEACQKHASQKRIKCVIEYIFDGSRVRCHVTDPQLSDYQYASFTLLFAGVTSPRTGNPKADPPIPTEPLSLEARQFVTARLLQRELQVSLVGADKSGMNLVGTVHHPAGNISVELLKAGFGRMTDWSVRMMPAAEVPPLRVAENNAKRTLKGIWHAYAPPVLSSASELSGIVIEVVSGDTLLILPAGKAYTSEDVLRKISLASIRAPRVGSERANRPDEPYAVECKERVRTLTIGKPVKVTIHYERDIPIRPTENETRAFGTVAVGKCPDVSEVLITEGLATTQRHRDDDEKSPRYDEFRVAEAVAKAAKKGVHKEGEYKHVAIVDLTDPRKAKSYSSSLERTTSNGKTVKGIVEYVFNGALFRLFVPTENCYIRFSPNCIRCPQPSPSPGSRQQDKKSEPFGDEAKLHARMSILQRQVEVTCSGVTNGGIILGTMYIGGAAQRRDYTIDLLSSGYANVDQRKIDYDEAPKSLVDAQNIAKQNKVGIWSLEQVAPVADSAPKGDERFEENVIKAHLSEIRSGSHFFYHVVGDEALKVMDDSMAVFTQNNGTTGAECDAKNGKVVAALFDDGTGKRWYRAKVVEKKGPGKVAVLFVDYGNIATVPIDTHLRPLDMTLGTDRIPSIAKEAVLAFAVTRSLDTDEGLDAARMLQSTCWGKDLNIRTFAPDENGKMAVSATIDGADETVNAQLVSEGLARAARSNSAYALTSRLPKKSSNVVTELMASVTAAQDTARKSRRGMWRYGDVGDDDPTEI